MIALIATVVSIVPLSLSLNNGLWDVYEAPKYVTATRLSDKLLEPLMNAQSELVNGDL